MSSLPNIVVNGSDASRVSHEFLGLNRKGSVGCVLVNGWGDGAPSDYAAVHALLAEEPYRLVRRFQDIEDAKSAGQLAVILGIQHATVFSQAGGADWGFVSANPDLRLDWHYDQGLRVLNFAYNVTNQFGGGCLDPDVGLTVSGRYLLGALEERGILVDTGGHTARRTALDVATRARKPVICSHANIRALNANYRCLTDDVIKAIADTGGVVGITASDDLMQRNAATADEDLPHCTLARFADEFDYVRKLVGGDHVGIGPDFVHGKIMPDSLGRSILFPPEMVKPQRHLRFALGFEDPSQFPNLAAELGRRGWSAEDIAKAMGQNWLRAYRAIWNN